MTMTMAKQQEPKLTEMPIEAKPMPIEAKPAKKRGRGAGPRPNRQKLKKQITVRLDEDLLKAALARAEAEQLRLTDAIEDGLWLWIQRRPPAETAKQLRFLCNVAPLDLQRLTLTFWDIYNCSKSSKLPVFAELNVKQFIEFLRICQEDPPCEGGLQAMSNL